jgi:hypothetical protein
MNSTLPLNKLVASIYNIFHSIIVSCYMQVKIMSCFISIYNVQSVLWNSPLLSMLASLVTWIQIVSDHCPLILYKCIQHASVEPFNSAAREWVQTSREQRKIQYRRCYKISENLGSELFKGKGLTVVRAGDWYAAVSAAFRSTCIVSLAQVLTTNSQGVDMAKGFLVPLVSYCLCPSLCPRLCETGLFPACLCVWPIDLGCQAVWLPF